MEVHKEMKQSSISCLLGSQDVHVVWRHVRQSVVQDAAPPGGPRTHYVDKMAGQDVSAVSGLFILAATLCADFHTGLVKGTVSLTKSVFFVSCVCYIHQQVLKSSYPSFFFICCYTFL